MTLGRSLMKIRNKVGPRIEPGGGGPRVKGFRRVAVQYDLRYTICYERLDQIKTSGEDYIALQLVKESMFPNVVKHLQDISSHNPHFAVFILNFSFSNNR